MKLVVTLMILLSALSCSQNKQEQKYYSEKVKNSNGKLDTLHQFQIFMLPPQEQLLKQSKILMQESFKPDSVVFITGNLGILAVDEDAQKMAYLDILPKTAPDNNFYIQLIIQELKGNHISVAMEWTINNEEDLPISLKNFFDTKKNEIFKVVKDNGIQVTTKDLVYNPANIKKQISVKNNFVKAEMLGVELKVISSVDIVRTFPKGPKLRYYRKDFCNKCDSLPIYASDILGSAESKKQNFNIHIVGLLERVEHSPSALHFRLFYFKSPPPDNILKLNSKN